MSAARCNICGAGTYYRCLSCTKPICNRSNNCSIAAPEETTGWKAGSLVSFCVSCTQTAESGSESLPSGTRETNKPRQDSRPRTAVGSHLHKKRKCLDLSQKFAVLEYAKKHPNLGSRKIADQFGTGKTQIQAILRNKESIVTLYESNICRNQVKRSRTAKYSDVNEAVWDWYTLCRKSNIPVSGAMLQEEAMIIAEKLEMNDFVASNGWLDRFKRQHNICNMAVAGEAGDVSTETVENWNERAREITRGWKAENIWNMDETGSFWRGLPEKTLSEKGRRCTGGKQAKQRLTWAFFTNAAGEKEDPVMIGKSANPRCFKNLKSKHRPYNCSYFASKKAWMTTEVMTEVLSKLNGRLKRRNRQILLFMDNAPCHPESLKGKFSNINVVFLPKNTTSKTQPLDAGIIASWKVLYRKRMLRYVCSKVDGVKNAAEIVKSINVLMAIEWGREAWNDVATDTIKKCFQKTGLYAQEEIIEDDPFEGEELQDLQTLVNRIDSQCSAKEYIHGEDDIAVCSGLIDPSDQNWRETVRAELLDDDVEVLSAPDDVSAAEEDDFDKEVEQPAIKSLTEAMKLAEQLRHFAQFHGHQELSLSLAKSNDLIYALKLEGPKRQTHLKDFFK